MQKFAEHVKDICVNPICPGGLCTSLSRIYVYSCKYAFKRLEKLDFSHLWIWKSSTYVHYVHVRRIISLCQKKSSSKITDLQKVGVLMIWVGGHNKKLWKSIIFLRARVPPGSVEPLARFCSSAAMLIPKRDRWGGTERNLVIQIHL